MLIKTLFHELTGMDPRVKADPPARLTPDTVNYFFLERGHVMEYFRVGDKKIVALFFGPGEFVLPAHIDLSCFEMLDDVVTEPLTYGKVIRALRNYAEADRQYRKIQACYKQKVAGRLCMRKSMSTAERFAYLKATQPWVLELAAAEDVASYLGMEKGVLSMFV